MNREKQDRASLSKGGGRTGERAGRWGAGGRAGGSINGISPAERSTSRASPTASGRASPSPTTSFNIRRSEEAATDESGQSGPEARPLRHDHLEAERVGLVLSGAACASAAASQSLAGASRAFELKIMGVKWGNESWTPRPDGFDVGRRTHHGAPKPLAGP